MHVVFLVILFVLAALPSAQADLLDDCTRGKTTQTKVRACTNLIEQERFAKLPADTRALVYYARGFGYYERGDFERTLADAAMAVDLKPEDTRFIPLRGVAFYEQGVKFDSENRDQAKRDARFESTLSDINRVIAIDPNNAQAYSTRGMVYHSKGDFERAVDEQTRAISIDPKNVNAYLWRGKSQMAQAMVRRKPEAKPRAIEDFRAALKINPKSREARELLRIAQEAPIPSK